MEMSASAIVQPSSHPNAHDPLCFGELHPHYRYDRYWAITVGRQLGSSDDAISGGGGLLLLLDPSTASSRCLVQTRAQDASRIRGAVWHGRRVRPSDRNHVPRDWHHLGTAAYLPTSLYALAVVAGTSRRDHRGALRL
eukprot:gb/GECH01012476.1/.p1 GENE.gb/GECH01012476.1/~~gb/GECH01012476.1/.p1  ORF type:complete len:138 (+),score=11.16 gb/GECH01012476.1/:1-414(+)